MEPDARGEESVGWDGKEGMRLGGWQGDSPKV